MDEQQNIIIYRTSWKKNILPNFGAEILKEGVSK